MRILSVIGAFAFSASGLSANPLPPILDFYPVCDYQVLDTISVKRNIKNRRSEEVKARGPQYVTDGDKIIDVTPGLLKKLQQEAANMNADALILTKREIKEKSLSRSTNAVVFRYEAEVFSNCDDLSADESRPAKYSSSGDAIISKYDVKLNFEYEMPPPPVREKRVIKELTSTNVSLDDGAYGVKLGDSEQKVYEVFGSPSAELYAFANERVIGYGRKLWFHFSDDQLLKITTRSELLNQAGLNFIEHRNLLDDYPWKLNNQVGIFATESEVKNSVGFDFQTINERLVYLREQNQLKLSFAQNYDAYSDTHSRSLSGFSLLRADYQPSPLRKYLVAQGLNQSLQEIHKKLTSGEQISREQLSHRLGRPIAKLIGQNGEEVLAFSENLLVTIKNERIRKIHFSESIFANTGSKVLKRGHNNWAIDQIHRGLESSKAKAFFSGQGFETEGQVEYEFEYHITTLLFYGERGNEQVSELVFDYF
jgi:hypothetical protein